MFVNFLDYKLKAKDGQPSGYLLRRRYANTVATTGGTPTPVTYGGKPSCSTGSATRCSLVEIARFFPSSKTCSCCGHVVDELTLDIREGDCSLCGTHYDRDGNAALNIRNEGIRILSNGGGKPSKGRWFTATHCLVNVWFYFHPIDFCKRFHEQKLTKKHENGSSFSIAALFLKQVN